MNAGSERVHRYVTGVITKQPRKVRNRYRRRPIASATNPDRRYAQTAPTVYASAARVPQSAGLAYPAAFATAVACAGSQLEIAHHPVVVASDRRKASRVRRRLSGSRRISASVNGRPDAAAGVVVRDSA